MKRIDLDKVIVLDIETLINCYVVCCVDYKTHKKKEFIFFDDNKYKNQPFEFFKFLRNCIREGYVFCTFNGIAFDMQVLHYYFKWCGQKLDPLYELETKDIIGHLYGEAQRLINRQIEDRKSEQNLYLAVYLHKEQNIVYEDDLFAPTIDLFKQNHYDRPQKYTSLKWLGFTMRMPIIEEMPIPHDVPITLEQITDVVEYCWNDVDTTLEFFERKKFETELRLALSKEYGRNLINASEPRMAREIFGKFLQDEMQVDRDTLWKSKTVRKWVAFKDIILPYVSFVTPELKKVLADFKAIVINTTPNQKDADKLRKEHYYDQGEALNAQVDFEYGFNYNGLQIDLGLGGIHSCVTPGVYTCSDDEYFEDADVISFYPKLAIENGLKPRHLGDSFSKIYNNIFEQRQLIPKKDPKNYIYKILLNATYGLSSEINSYFYDRQFTYAITINGQLSLLMLVEALYKAIPGVRFIQKNTDGVTFIYKKQYFDKVRKVCDWWQKVTKMKLEYAYYSKMVVQDVNNYIGVYAEPDKWPMMAPKAALKPKKKGLFETEIEYHKNPSYLIVPKALNAYFVDGKNIEAFVKGHDNVHDFCGAVKKKSNFKLNLYTNIGGTELCREQQKVTRYVVSTTADSGLLFKDFLDGRKISILAGVKIEPLQIIKPDMQDPSRYKLNYDWYLKECRKIIDFVQPPQTTLF